MASLGYLRPSMMAQVFPGSPRFTDKDVPDLTGKVCLVTGANAGVGKALTRILYAKNATVWMACRSEAKCRRAMEEIEAAAVADADAAGGRAPPAGRLAFLALDLGDLRTVKPAAEALRAQTDRLDVLFNNAGVMLPPDGADAKTAQGYDLQLGTNCVAPFLLTQLLTPLLAATARQNRGNEHHSDNNNDDDLPPGARVVWVASMAAELYSERHGIDAAANLRGPDYVHPSRDPLVLYGNSKAGVYLHSVAYARRHRADGIASVAVNPGNLDSDLYRSVGGRGGDSGGDAGAGGNSGDHKTGLGALQHMAISFFTRAMLHPPVYGAYTELFAAFSPQVTMAKSGAYIGPWGRFFAIRADLAKNAKPKAEGGRGGADALWDWTMEQIKPFM